MANLTITLDPSSDGSYNPDYPTGDKPSGGNGNPAYAPFPIQIIQPVAGLNTTNRYYKQYTGVEYNVKTYVRGGDYSALQYSLTTSPSGMTINSVTGVISWPNPTESGSPHNVTVSVTDGLTTGDVSWTVTVDTTNTLFLDSTVATSGVGTIGDPMKDIPDWYLDDKNDDTYENYQVYYRAGDYTLDSTTKTKKKNNKKKTNNKNKEKKTKNTTKHKNNNNKQKNKKTKNNNKKEKQTHKKIKKHTNTPTNKKNKKKAQKKQKQKQKQTTKKKTKQHNKQKNTNKNKTQRKQNKTNPNTKTKTKTKTKAQKQKTKTKTKTHTNKKTKTNTNTNTHPITYTTTNNTTQHNAKQRNTKQHKTKQNKTNQNT